MTLGEKLLELRRKSAVSQDALAEKLGVSRQAVSKWERDEAVPETDKIIKIAQLFGVSTDYLLLDQPERPTDTSKQAPPSRGMEHRAEQFICRHGYKGGYVLIAWGAFICLVCIGMRLLWPVIAGGFFDSVMGDDPFSNSWGGSSGIVTDINGNELGTWNDLFGNAPVIDQNGKLYDSLEEMLGSGYKDPFFQSQKDTVSAAVNAQANIFLIGLLPGGLLIAAGLFILVKGKQFAQKEESAVQ